MTDTFKSRFVKARKEYIRSRFPHLNDMQKDAVLATEGPLLILAGAGSGKTTVLINRIYNILKYGCASDSDLLPPDASEEQIRILEEHEEGADEAAALAPAQPWQILAITFTNKAADELKDRLEKLLDEGAKEIWACTFHSACVRILRRDAERLGFTPNFNIYDTSDSQTVIKQILKDRHLDNDKNFAPRMVLSEISRAKDCRILPEEFLMQAHADSNQHRIEVGKIYREYRKVLADHDALDFDDLLLYTVSLLNDNPDVLEYWQNRFHYVLIDEYQDTNLLQYEFSALMAGRRKNICVVGDDDQSIYKFRGATIENILSFEKQYRDCRTIRLEENYRSTGHILDAANAVISRNTKRMGKNLWTEKDAGVPIEVKVTENEREEALYVTSRILAGQRKGERFSDYAVLYRMNAQSNALEYGLKMNGVPYRIVGGTRFFDRQEVKDILSYLCVISSDRDDLRLERIINEPPRGIGDKSIDTARDIARREGISLFSVISHADRYRELIRPCVSMRLFSGMIRELQEFAKTHPTDVLFDEVIDKTGYVRALEEKDTPESRGRIENVLELKSTILTYMRETGDESLAGYLANVMLYTDLDNLGKGDDAVTLMTMHSAKGLEFPHVIVTGMEETVFPGVRAMGDEEEMEEERRLCYVAITRAMKTLDLVCARSRMLFGHTSTNRLSRFVDDIPEEHLKGDIRKGMRYSDPDPEYHTRSDSMFGSGYPERKGSASGRKEPKKPLSFVRNTSSIQPPKEPMQLEVGDRVRHKAFGEGRVVKMTPMGKDYLIEISFESVGSKKLMLRVASIYMEKIGGEEDLPF